MAGLPHINQRNVSQSDQKDCSLVMVVLVVIFMVNENCENLLGHYKWIGIATGTFDMA